MGKYVSSSVVVSYDLDGKLVKVFKTAKEASDELNLFSRTIDKAIRNNSLIKGYQWRRYICMDDVKTSIPPYTKPIIKPNRVVIAKVNEEGEILKIYPSILSASKENNISPKQIRECLLGHQLRAGSYYWKKIEKKDWN